MARPVAGRTSLRVASINSPVKVRRAAWERCWLEAAARADMFVVNETLSMAQRRTYRALARQHGFKQTGLWATPNPIFSRKSVWRRTSARRYRLHARLKWHRRWPGYNAARWATVVALKHRTTGERVTVIGTHLVPRGKKVEPGSRIRARAKSRRVLNRILANQKRLGRSVVVLGDVNMDPPPDLDRVRWLAEGIDQVGIAPRPGVVADTHYPAARFRIPSDHKHGTFANITLEEKR